ncbi:hypothetical protein EAKF1_ch1797c [Escherichia albertii KF1]|nr:hypothetical protein EAKF1_ch1797c [Escherichia albertii KF1]
MIGAFVPAGAAYNETMQPALRLKICTGTTDGNVVSTAGYCAAAPTLIFIDN